jgi:hypothetical protein
VQLAGVSPLRPQNAFKERGHLFFGSPLSSEGKMPSALHSLLEKKNVCAVEIGETFFLLPIAVGVSLHVRSLHEMPLQHISSNHMQRTSIGKARLCFARISWRHVRQGSMEVTQSKIIK